jgi:hypothetical protein
MTKEGHTQANLRDIESELESALRKVRELLAAAEPGGKPARPRSGQELIEALGIPEPAKKGPPFKWIESYMQEYGPTRKSELIAIFADAFMDAYETPGRAIGSMCQSINMAARGENPKVIAVESRGGTLAKVPYQRNPLFAPRNEPKNILIIKYADPDQLLALPRQLKKR